MVNHIMKKCLLIIIVSTLLPLASFGEASQRTGSPELVVHLLDYLAKDYGGAVQNGTVVSKSEYAEQIEFAAIVKKNSESVETLKADPAFLVGIEQLMAMIRSKSSATEVSKLARELQQNAIRLAEIQVAPTAWPDVANGAKLYQANCVSCHGVQGNGDGIAGAALDPKPANFHDPDLVWNSAPYKFFNTIRLGVPGTGMAAFPHFSDQEVWALAFYLKSLPYKSVRHTGSSENSLSLQDSATLTDAEIAERLGGKNEKVLAVIGALRASSGGPKGEDPLQVADELLAESLHLAKEKKFDEASRAALRAYLEGIEPIEPKARANLPGSVEQIEMLMSDFRSSLDRKEAFSIIEEKKNAVSNKLRELKTLLSERKMSPGVAFGAAFSIFLREGFEAILIIVVLVSILRAMGQTQAIKWVHFGWATAVAFGLIAWFASGVLLAMSGLSRELMEGAISTLAVVVLLYVGVWLHRYSEIKKWRAFLEAKLRHGLSKGSYLGLALVSFMAVFREAFEVVLFLRAIWIDLDQQGQLVASGGVLSSILFLSILSIVAIRESKKLPLGILFQVCSATMIILSIILAGKGAHSLQEAGVLSVSSFGLNFRLDIIGLYPSVQTLLAQALVIAVFAVAIVTERRMRPEFEYKK
jgi:high-affinity iron transporter